MNIDKWLIDNTHSLKNKTVAVTGTTGGIGRSLVGYLATLGANLILLDRNRERSESLKAELTALYSDTSVKCITLDLSITDQVKKVTNELKKEKIDVLIHNAGAYKIPRCKCSTGLDNVFQINFASPYYITKELLSYMQGGRVVIVGSIAHNYSVTDVHDKDFSKREKSSLVYGNAKRYLMYSFMKLFENREDVTLSVTHPGITLTNITSHYPKLIFALIKHPMKIIFMKPDIATLSILKGVFEETKMCEWIGPSAFNIWGYPKKKKLKTATAEEIEEIFVSAEKLNLRMYDLQ